MEGTGTHDVGRDGAVDVAEADDHAERDAALVRALDVVRNPRDDVRDARVDAARREVDREVGQRGIARCDEDDVAGKPDNEAAPTFEPVRTRE